MPLVLFAFTLVNAFDECGTLLLFNELLPSFAFSESNTPDSREGLLKGLRFIDTFDMDGRLLSWFKWAEYGLLSRPAGY